MRRISRVKVLPGYRLELEFDDGVSRTVNLSEAVGKGVFAQLHQQKAAIEKDLGLDGKLDWQELPDRKASRIRTFAPFDFDDDKTWEKAFQWLAETCIMFKKTFAKNWSKSTQQEGGAYR